MTENYKKQWEMINCRRCKFAPYSNHKGIKCTLDEEEKKEIRKFSICREQARLNRVTKESQTQ